MWIVLLLISAVSGKVLCGHDLFGKTDHILNVTSFGTAPLRLAHHTIYTKMSLPPALLGIADLWDATYYAQSEMLYSPALGLSMWRTSCLDKCLSGNIAGPVDTTYQHDTVLLLGPVRWQNGLYHVIYDGLVLAAALPDSFISDSIIAVQDSRYATQYAAAMFPGNKVALLDPTRNYRFRRAYLPSGTPCGISTSHHLNAARGRLSVGAEVSITLFSGRRGRGRHISNWDQIIRVYTEAYPTHVICEHLGNESAQDAFALFARASIVIGLHGAGLSHLLACRSGTIVIEITPVPYSSEMDVNTCYGEISSKLALSHYLLPVPGDSSYYKEPLDINVFLETVNRSLSQK